MNNKNEQKHMKVTKFFHEHIGDKEIIIKSVKRIHKGLTNQTYCVKTNKGKYQVRFAKDHDGIDRDIERQVLEQTTGYIYFDKDGNMIRKWLHGRPMHHAFIWRKINKVFYAQNLLHTKQIKTNKKVDYKKDMDNTKKHCKKNELYLELIDKFNCTSNFTISHNDVTNKNVICHHSKTYLIDYEWAKLNYDWFDLVYFLIHTHMPRHMLVKIANEKMNKITNENFFFVSYFCLNWIHTVKDQRLKFKYLKRKYERNVFHFYHATINELHKEQHNHEKGK